MNQQPENRRKDHILRSAIEGIHRDLPELDSHEKVFRQTFATLCALSGSRFGFVLENTTENGEQATLHCRHAFSYKPGQDCITTHACEGHLTIDSDCRALFSVLNLRRTIIPEPSVCRSIQAIDVNWPTLERVLAIPLTDGKTTKRIICLANAEQAYDLDFTRRMWPLLTTCTSLIRITEHRQLQTTAEKRLLLAQDNWRENFEKLESLLPVAMITLGRQERILRMNAAAEATFGVAASKTVGHLIQELIPQKIPLHLFPRNLCHQTLDQGHDKSIQVEGKHANGDKLKLKLSLVSFDEYQQPRTLLIIQDESKLNGAVKDQQIERQRFRALADLTPLGVLRTNHYWQTEYANERWYQITGTTADKAQGLDWSKILYHEDAEDTLNQLHKSISKGRELKIECRVQKEKQVIWVEFSALPIFDVNGDVDGFLATIADNSAAYASQDRLRHLAERDALTGLANRSLFFDRVEQALTRVERHGSAALLALDLDGFKNVNDTLGHDVGDSILVEVSQRLVHCVRNEDTVSRVGGDEFFILLEGLHDASMAAGVSEKILTTLEIPFNVGQQEIFISTSIGISFAVSGHTTNLKSLLKQADMALYRAKDAGRNNFQYYSPELEHASRKKLELGNSLHRALGRAEFEVFYQAQATVADNEVNGFEALLRWQHPFKGLLPPMDFIPLLEETGLISPVSRWLFQVSFKQLRQWIDDGLVDKDATMAVNISPQQFRDPTLVQTLEAAMGDANLSGKNIVVEITETAFIRDQTQVQSCLKKIRAMGIKVALDDFGTGYSSLSYLKQFPIDIIKIDRSFVKDLLVDKEDAAITQAVIVLADSLGMKVLAEGVENHEILAVLKNWGCGCYQGYLLNQPMPSEKITPCLSAWRGTHGHHLSAATQTIASSHTN